MPTIIMPIFVRIVASNQLVCSRPEEIGKSLIFISVQGKCILEIRYFLLKAPFIVHKHSVIAAK